jgi:4-aminobutyrate aminotransferase
LPDGVAFRTCGIHANAVRILAPLTIPDSQLEESPDILEASLVRARA